MQTYLTFFSFCCVISLTLLVLSCVIFSFTYGRKFDKKFKKYPAGLFDPRILGISKFYTRPLTYMLAIVRGLKFSNRPSRNRLYGEYNFKENASKGAIRFSYFAVFFAYLVLVFALIGGVFLIWQNGTNLF